MNEKPKEKIPNEEDLKLFKTLNVAAYKQVRDSNHLDEFISAMRVTADHWTAKYFRR